MPNQLHLTAIILKKLGFDQKVLESKEVIYKLGDEKVFIYFMPFEEKHPWGFKFNNGHEENDGISLVLDIETIEQLNTITNSFPIRRKSNSKECYNTHLLSPCNLR